MTRDAFDAVRQLLRQKRDGEAVALLKTIDHPQARAWLAEMEEEEAVREGRRHNNGVYGLSGALVVLIGMLLVGGVLALLRWIGLPG